MPSISGVPVIATKDSTGTVISPINLALRFDGATVTLDGTAQTLISISGGGGGGWSTSGNSLTGGEVFGSSNTSSAPDVVSVYNGVEYSRLDSLGAQWNSDQFRFKYPSANFYFGTNTGNFQIYGGLNSIMFGDATSGNIRNTSGSGTLAFGVASSTGLIQVDTAGSCAFGVADGANSEITSIGTGTFAHGYASAGRIIAQNIGAEASGIATNNGSIQSYGSGSYARGTAINNGNIFSFGEGSFANGYVAGNYTLSVGAAGALASCYLGFGGVSIGTGALGSLTIAYTNFGAVVNNGRGSIVVGDNIDNQATYSQVFGYGTRGTFAALVSGRYPLSIGNATAWTSTDPLFLIGNGTSVSRKDAFRIDKDGLQYQTAALVNTAIRAVGTGPVTVNARTDKTIVLSFTLAATGGNVNLPAGVNGQIFTFTTGGTGGAPVWTLVPNGADTLDAAVPTTITSAFSIQFLSSTGSWHKV